MKKGKLFYNIQFKTRQLKCLNEINNIFYINKKSIKTIKFELYDYFDYIVFAHLIMSNGIKRNKGLILCTDKFTINEIILLMNIINIKFNIKSSIHKNKDKYRIYINQVELNKIKYKLYPYFIDIFYYKIHM